MHVKCWKCKQDFSVNEAIFCETCESKIICPRCETCNCITCKIEDMHDCRCIEERVILKEIEEDRNDRDFSNPAHEVQQTLENR